MGNCKQCKMTNADGENQIRADEKANLPLQFNLFLNGNITEDDDDKNKFQDTKSSRSCKQGLIIQRLYHELTVQNVQVLNQPMSQAQKLIAKNALKKHFLFSQLQEYQLEIILNKIILCTSKTGEYIFREGNLAGSYYIILQGQCDLQIDQVFKKSLKVGDAFGDLAIIYNSVRTGSIKSSKDCILGMISSPIFSKIIEQINQSEEAENLDLLEEAQVFKNFTTQYKQAIAAHCLTQLYDQGQVVINQGDRANSLYIIKKGVLIILEKNIEIGPGQCLGQTCVLGDGIRSNTVFCKTKAQLVSISSQALNRVLGQTAKRRLILNLINKIIRDSKVICFKTDEQIQSLVENCDIKQYRAGQVVIQKQEDNNDTIYVNIGSILKGDTQSFRSNVVLKPDQFILKRSASFQSDFIALKNGFLAKVSLIEGKKAERYRRLSQQICNKQQKSTKEEKLMQLNDLYFIKLLKEGNFGTVLLTYFKSNHKFYIVKAINAQQVEQENLAIYIQNQQKVLRDVKKHPFIVNFHKLVRDVNYYYFIMDYIFGQDMFDFLNRVSTINQSHVLFYMSQLLMALEHLHNQKIVYRDLKPQNIMIGHDGYLVMIDFGSAKVLSLEQRYKTKTIIGTPHYMAPQIIIGKGYSFSADYWSLGIVAYQMMFGRLPYGDQQDDPFSIYQDIMNKKNIYFPKKSKDDIKDLVIKLLHKKPQKRIGFNEIKAHKCMENIQWEKIFNKSVPSPHLPQYQKYLNIEDLIKKPKHKQKIPQKLVKIVGKFYGAI